jgi:hypothetical protein
MARKASDGAGDSLERIAKVLRVGASSVPRALARPVNRIDELL